MFPYNLVIGPLNMLSETSHCHQKQNGQEEYGWDSTQSYPRVSLILSKIIIIYI